MTDAVVLFDHVVGTVRQLHRGRTTVNTIRCAFCIDKVAEARSYDAAKFDLAKHLEDKHPEVVALITERRADADAAELLA